MRSLVRVQARAPDAGRRVAKVGGSIPPATTTITEKSFRLGDTLITAEIQPGLPARAERLLTLGNVEVLIRDRHGRVGILDPGGFDYLVVGNGYEAVELCDLLDQSNPDWIYKPARATLEDQMQADAQTIWSAQQHFKNLNHPSARYHFSDYSKAENLSIIDGLEALAANMIHTKINPMYAAAYNAARMLVGKKKTPDDSPTGQYNEGTVAGYLLLGSVASNINVKRFQMQRAHIVLTYAISQLEQGLLLPEQHIAVDRQNQAA